MASSCLVVSMFETPVFVKISAMTIIKKAIFALTACAVASSASAADFFSAAKPQQQFRLGAHFGVNTSNRTVVKDAFDVWNHNSWGTGIDVGVTADIYFRDWISIQPGFFYDSRSGDFSYAYNIGNPDGSVTTVYQLGHGRTYNFIIPIMASCHFNITDDLRWNVEVGPYVQIGLKNTFGNKSEYPLYVFDESLNSPLQGMGTMKSRVCDFGFKFGTGLTILSHYDFSIHYLAGSLDVWKPSVLRGRNKEWVFSIGYIL